MSDPRHDRGGAGEQSMGFYWGERGYFLVDGPSGAGGHKPNAPGFDGVAYNPTTDHMVIYDNKAFARDGNITSSSALVDNALANIDAAMAKARAAPDMPRQQDVLNHLTAARSALDQGTPWPKNVSLAVSNASGQSTGVGGKAAKAGIIFVDYNAAPSPKPAPQSAPASTRPSPPRPRLPLGSKIGAGIRIGGQAALSHGIGFLIMLLFKDQLQRWQDSEFRRQRNQLEPAIKLDFALQKETAIKLLLAGSEAHAHVRFATNYGMSMHMGDTGWADTAPSIEYLGLAILPFPAGTQRADGTARREAGFDWGGKMIVPGAMTPYKLYYDESAPVTIPAEELELYRYYVQQIEYHERLSKAAMEVRGETRAWGVSRQQEHALKAEAYRRELKEAMTE